jgi:L-alanine-DL-glutamate epimerase-like enolase superfamily enzyme
MKLELRRVTIKSPGARDARRSWPERERLLLRLCDAQGAFGLGEASPLPGYSRDDLADVEAALRRLETSRLQAALEPGLAALGRELRVSVLSAVASLLPEALPAARMGIETAALDFLSRRAGVSAPRWLGAMDGAALRLAALIGAAAEPEMLERARGALDQGYTHLKLKVGAAGLWREESAAIVALRHAVTPGVSLRLDANGAWSASELRDAWQVLRSCGLELFEEPGELPEALLGELPLALDESLQGLSAGQAAARLRQQRAQAVVLKPTALGGLSHCFELAKLAAAASAGVVLSHCFEGSLAFRAAAAVALALPAGLAAGLSPHAGLPVGAVANLVRSGTLHVWSEPGLGDPVAFE